MSDEEETMQQRATRILNESIAFRTSLISEIHKEIHADAWGNGGPFHPCTHSCRSRTSEHTFRFCSTSYIEMGKGKRQIGVVTN